MKTSIYVVASLLLGCTQKSQDAPSKPPILPVSTVVTSNVTTYQDYPASIEGIANVEIRPQVSGLLERIYVDEGAFVRAGTPLFRIDDKPFQASLSNAVASLHAAQASLSNANLEIEKLTPLVANKVIADYQLKTARVTGELAQANVEQANALISSAKINLGYTLIKAPVSGYVGRILKKQGTLISPQDADELIQISDVSNLHVYFSLAEKDFVSFKDQYTGRTLEEKVKNLPPVSLLLANNSIYPIKGKIDAVDGQFDKNTGAITLRANFPNPDGVLRSGNTGKVQLGVLHSNIVMVPQSATAEIQNKVLVFVVADSNKVKKQPITIIARNGDKYLVSEGIKAGDKIVLSGFDNLPEGTVIQPTSPTSKETVAKN